MMYYMMKNMNQAQNRQSQARGRQDPRASSTIDRLRKKLEAKKNKN